jgi:plastocyanin
MKRYPRTLAATSLILISMSLVAGCSKSDNKSTNPGGGVALELSSGDLGGGAVYPHRFFTAGNFAYHCARHPTMKATVIVSASAPAGDSLGSVSIVDFAFSPTSVTIPVNGKVTWTNTSATSTVHTVTSDP